MKPTARFLCIAAAAALLFSIPALADRLELKDGTLIKGTYMGGSRVNVHFRVDGETKIYKREDVSAIYLGDAVPAKPVAAAAPAAPAAATAPAAPEQRVNATSSGGTVPTGSVLMVRMIDGVDSAENKAGDTFRASLDEDLAVDGVIIIPKGADVTGKLVEVKEAGRLTGKSELKLELTEIFVNNTDYALVTGEYGVAGEGRGKDTAMKVGGGAAIGAVIGAIAGGGKGAAIGAGIGAGAGTAIQVMTRGEQVKVPSETLLEFTLEQDLVIRRPSTRRRR